MQDITQMVWEDFTQALGDNNTFDAELILDSTNSKAGEAGWEELIMKMYDEWNLWLVGKSKYNG